MAQREKLPRTFEKFKKSIENFKESLSSEFETKYPRKILVEIVIKRFEYTFESMWKTLQELILEEGIECLSPLSSFKNAYKLGLIDEKYEHIFPLMVKKRNEIVHVYSSDAAYEIYLLIKNTFKDAIFDLYDKVQKKLNI
jgi:nucleotidyltransferase substrate binding protein (TIGR01987 family)